VEAFAEDGGEEEAVRDPPRIPVNPSILRAEHPAYFPGSSASRKLQWATLDASGFPRRESQDDKCFLVALGLR